MHRWRAGEPRSGTKSLNIEILEEGTATAAGTEEGGCRGRERIVKEHETKVRPEDGRVEGKQRRPDGRPWEIWWDRGDRRGID